MHRRSFLKSAGVSALAASPMANAWAQPDPLAKAKSSGAISQLKKNTAIAMWDFTWILRHDNKRTAIFTEEGGLLRAWKTLAFLDKNGQPPIPSPSWRSRRSLSEA